MWNFWSSDEEITANLRDAATTGQKILGLRDYQHESVVASAMIAELNEHAIILCEMDEACSDDGSGFQRSILGSEVDALCSHFVTPRTTS
jgi:hypothetical protein